MFLQQSERFADDFASRVVATRLHFATDEFFQFRRERDIHGNLRVLFIEQGNLNSEDCQCLL